jgi:hypothetical protein
MAGDLARLIVGCWKWGRHACCFASGGGAFTLSLSPKRMSRDDDDEKVLWWVGSVPWPPLPLGVVGRRASWGRGLEATRPARPQNENPPRHQQHHCSSPRGRPAGVPTEHGRRSRTTPHRGHRNRPGHSLHCTARTGMEMLWNAVAALTNRASTYKLLPPIMHVQCRSS